jgi:hypothetical protein
MFGCQETQPAKLSIGGSMSVAVIDEYLELLDRVKSRLTFDEETGEGSILELWSDIEVVGYQKRRYYHHYWDKYVHTDHNPDRLIRLLNHSDRPKILKWAACSDELLSVIDDVIAFVYNLIVYYDPNPVGRLCPDRLSETISKWRLLDVSAKNAIVGYVDSRVSRR